MMSLRVLLLAIYAVCGVLGDYDFQVRLFLYANPRSNCHGCGGCCDPGESVCTCDNLFQFCLRELWTPAASRSSCSFTTNTQAIESDYIFFRRVDIFPNRSVLDITSSGPWMGVQFYMEVIDFDSSTVNQFVDSFSIDVNSPISSSFSARLPHFGLHNIGLLEFDYRIVCSDDFYGTDCSVFCRPMMDINGIQMYSCNSDGSRNCLNGYIGELCNERDQCGEVPINCYSGQCVSNPLGCICDAGYTGTFCDFNIDDCVGVNCSGGGVCQDGVNSYTCVYSTPPPPVRTCSGYGLSNGCCIGTCYVPGGPGCFCDRDCYLFEDCCSDVHLCPPTDCFSAGLPVGCCELGLDSCTVHSPDGTTCHCDSLCTAFDDCCSDVDPIDTMICPFSINECALGTDNCHVNATCTDTTGSFSCTCNLGFSGDGVVCEYSMTLVTVPEIVLANSSVLCEMTINDVCLELNLVIDWFHNGKLVHSSTQAHNRNGRYLASYNLGTETVSSTLKVTSLESSDNGHISCRTSSPKDKVGLDAIANLVVLGNNFDFELVFSSGEAVFVINLPVLLTLPVGLYFIYRDALKTSAAPQERNTSIYFERQNFTYVESDLPKYNRLRVQVGLVVHDVRGPLTPAKFFDRELNADQSFIIPAVILPIIVFIGIIFLAVMLTLCYRHRGQRRDGTHDIELQQGILSTSNPYTHPVPGGQVSGILADQADYSGNSPLSSGFALRRRDSDTIPLLDEDECGPHGYLGNEVFHSQPVDTSLQHLDDLQGHGTEITMASETASLTFQCYDAQNFVHPQNHSSMELYNPLLKRVIVRSHSMEAIFQAIERTNSLDKAGIPYIFSDQYLEANGETCTGTQCRWLHDNLQHSLQPENRGEFFQNLTLPLSHHGDSQSGAVRSIVNQSGPLEHVQHSARLHYQYQPYEQSHAPPYIGLDLFSGEHECITNTRHPYDAIELYERNNHPYSPRVDPVQYRGRRHSL